MSRWRKEFPFQRGLIRIGHPDYTDGGYRQEFQYIEAESVPAEQQPEQAKEHQSIWNAGDFLRYLASRGYSKKELIPVALKIFQSMV